MKKLITLFLTCFSLSLFAQFTNDITVSSSGCYDVDFIKTGNGTGIGGRNIYTIDTRTIIFTNTNGGRWEIQDVSPNAVVTDFYSTVATNPSPPNTSIGNWVKVNNSCGTLTLTGDVENSLPIELTAFAAQNTEGGKNQLTWRTESEKDNKHFDIERGTDGNTFHSIGQVKGNNKPSRYQFVDNQPFATSYYRLRQIDFDGTETLSKVVSVAQTGKGKGLTIYPNPVSNTLTVENISESRNLGTVEERNPDSFGKESSFQILNLLGQQVLTGKTGQRLDVSALPQGTYFLKIGAEQAKFVKQ